MMDSITFDFVMAGLDMNEAEQRAVKEIRLNKKNRVEVQRRFRMNIALLNRALQKFDDELNKIQRGGM